MPLGYGSFPHSAPFGFTRAAGPYFTTLLGAGPTGGMEILVADYRRHTLEPAHRNPGSG
jgi:hypothetical protein